MEHLTLEIPFEAKSSATISPCNRYRYDLWRHWAHGPYCMFIGLNPSTADGLNDDPTIRRCISFAKAGGYGALCMTNLFAYRATSPTVMKSVPDPIGEENDGYLTSLAAGAGIVIAAWGVHGVHRKRADKVIEMIPFLHCLGVTKEGHPKHPLYLSKNCKPVPFDNQ